jgi:nucleotide-binding universal stress UspA family protein
MDVEQAPGAKPKDDAEHGVQVALEAAQSSAPAAQEPAVEAAPDGVKDAAEAVEPPEQTEAKARESAKVDDPPVETAARAKDASVPEAVEAELAKGYDLVLFGLDSPPAQNALTRAVLEHIDKSYEGARAFVVARGRADGGALRLLLPVTGAVYSRRGAEIAVALAAAAGVPLSVLSVSRVAARRPWFQRNSEPLPEDRATIEAIQRLAEPRGVSIIPQIEAHQHPDVAITRYARRIGATLIVLGVKERLGPAPSFGPTADSVLTEAHCSVLLLST